MSDDADWLAAEVQRQEAQHDQLSTQIVEMFESMTDSERHAVALVEYRCRRGGCWPLFVWRQPGASSDLIYLRGFRMSSRRARETSTRTARARYTDDNGIWRPRGLIFDDLRDHADAGLRVKCYHLDRRVPVPDLTEDIRAGRSGKPTVSWF